MTTVFMVYPDTNVINHDNSHLDDKHNQFTSWIISTPRSHRQHLAYIHISSGLCSSAVFNIKNYFEKIKQLTSKMGSLGEFH